MAPPPAFPASLPPGVWRADRLGDGGVAALPSTFPELDAHLPGGGWPLGMLTELIAREPGVGELRLVVPVLRRLTCERKVAILLGPPHVPYAPALASFGIDLDYLIVVQAVQAADRLWAVEQALRSASFGTLLAWLPHERTRPEHLRRMQLAAQGTRGPVFLFRHLPAQFEASPAPLRLLLLPRPGQRLSVQLLKRRGPVLAQPLLLELPQPPSVARPARTAPAGPRATSRTVPDDASAPHEADAGHAAYAADAHAQAHAEAPSGGPGPRGLGAAHVLLPLGHDDPSPARPEP
ncbi:MAG: translesion DNA synthesis-associated protein ImuA, partial [Burkholderiaceae bacterium]|nr:translesion DNA synthesis-associated protein ImuA [Burkholderiaceae bacterium]